jgi:hypothetical protein
MRGAAGDDLTVMEKTHGNAAAVAHDLLNLGAGEEPDTFIHKGLLDDG